MDRKARERRLVEAEKHVRLGARIVARQRALVAQLERDGHDTAEAQRMLANFEEIHTHQIADRDVLRQRLATIASRHRPSWTEDGAS